MLVPEAPVYEDHQPVSRKHQVRPPGQIPPMQPEAESHGVEHPPDGELRLGVR